MQNSTQQDLIQEQPSPTSRGWQPVACAFGNAANDGNVYPPALHAKIFVAAFAAFYTCAMVFGLTSSMRS